MDLASGEMSGVEALVRWDHPERGLVAPMDFIPLAEETGLIVPLGPAHPRGRVPPGAPAPAHAARRCHAHHVGQPVRAPAPVADLVDDVSDALRASGIAPETLVLELTESVMMGDAEVAVAAPPRPEALGVRLAVDDFGTGYSSLNYIRQFPLDMLKVDRSFIRDINEGGENGALAEAIIDLAKVLNLRAVAEGIEDASQLERLRELDCGLGQGFHFYKPMTREAVEALAQRQAEGLPLTRRSP